jgi:hypothetical protein
MAGGSNFPDALCDRYGGVVNDNCEGRGCTTLLEASPNLTTAVSLGVCGRCSPVCQADGGRVTSYERILEIFGEASGLRVNYRKSTATLIRGDEEDEDRVRSILRCNLDSSPIRYLGLQLALKPLRRNQWQPLLDRALNSVPCWHRGLIDRPGCLIIIKSVIAVRPLHHLLVAEAPDWLLDELYKWQRAFF